MNFIKSIAKYFVEKYAPKEWENLVFVFPNHRSSVFFSNAVSDLMQACTRLHKPSVIFGIHITTMGDLLAKNSNLKVADQMTLRCKLYEAYRAVSAGETDIMPFERFYSWAGAILNDFEDIDKGLVDPATIYNNTIDYQKLSDDLSELDEEQRNAIRSFWNIEFQKETDAMGNEKEVYKKFLNSYLKMKALYSEFGNLIKKEGLTYAGKLYRDAATGLRDATETPWDDGKSTYAFIGFSLLSRAEDIIMTDLDKQKRALFFWDYNENMLSEDPNNRHSAGYAVAKWVKKFKAPEYYNLPKGEDCTKQKIRIIETDYPQSQAALIGSLLNNSDNMLIGEKQNVFVLPDEQMLLPVLSVLPEKVVKDVNVTMGYELRYTNISSLAHLMRDAHSTMFTKQYDNETVYSAQLVLSILQHPYIIDTDGLENTRNAMQDIINKNMYYVSPNNDALVNVPTAKQILQETTPNNLSAYATTIFQKILDTYTQKPNSTLTKEALWEALKVARRICNLIPLVTTDSSNPRTLTSLFLQMMCTVLDQQKVNFQGMPQARLQIMGILETRALDFKNVTILDMTEGKWPRSQMTDTMIPMLIRRGFGLPTNDDMTSTYNYYFYRLKNRAKNLTLIRPVQSSNGPTTISRYALQMKMLDNLQIEEITAYSKVNPQKEDTFEVEKTKNIMQAMQNMTLSPTSLSEYISCNLKFYFSKVAKLSQFDDVTEDADARQFGLIYHEAMEKLYKSNNGNLILTEDKKKKLLKDENEISRIIREAFAHNLNNDKLKDEKNIRGRNIITYDVIKSQVIQTIKTEYPGTEIIETEKKVQLPLQFNGIKVTLKGIIDRLHKCKGKGPDDIIFVADYKTGNVKTMLIKNVADLFDPKKHEDNKAIMQTLVYCYILRNGYNRKEPLTPFVIKVQNIFTDSDVENRIAKIGENKKNCTILTYSGDIEKQFNELLEKLFNEIFNPEIPFKQTEDKNTCSFCDYKHICHR